MPRVDLASIPRRPASFSQDIQVMEYMRENPQGVSNMNIMYDLGVSSPTKVISNIRKAGYTVSDRWEQAPDRYGYLTRFKVYNLEEE